MIGVFLTAVAGTVAAIYQHNGGTFTYPTDDPYIHLAMARNLLDHGTFGIAPHVYASASSSPLWTILLAGSMAIFGRAEWLPLALNVAIGIVLCNQVAKLVPWQVLQRRRLVTAVVLVGSAGIAPLAVIGMEHVLHASLGVAAFVLVERARRGDLDKRGAWLLAAVFAAGSLARFEMGFIAIGCMVALLALSSDRVGTLREGIHEPTLLHARVRPALIVFGATAVPILAFGAINIAFGGHLLPNSVIAKSAYGEGPLSFLTTTEGWRLLANRLVADPTLVAVVGLAAGTAVLATRTPSRKWGGTLVAFVIAALLHGVFAGVGRLDPYWARYDAYLVIAGIALLVAATRDLPPDTWRRAATLALVVVLGFTGFSRVVLLTKLPASSHEVQRQQLQTATFLGRYYDGRSVIVNDLGEVAWHHEGDVVDLVGLGTTEVLDAWKAGTFDHRFAEKVVLEHHAPVAAVYPEWFRGELPKQWVPVAQWCMDAPVLVTAGNTCMTWYGTDAAAAKELRTHLAEYRDDLPASVHQVAPA